MKLSKQTFESIIEATPLVSIDFVIRNDAGDCLLGLRKNAPAKDFWFNLGGRIFKNETIEQAQERIFFEETGAQINRKTLKLLGIYDHIYTDNLFNNPSFGTHYVCITYEITMALELPQTKLQHHRYEWRSISEILTSIDVHENTKIVFQKR